MSADTPWWAWLIGRAIALLERLVNGPPPADAPPPARRPTVQVDPITDADRRREPRP